MPVEKNGGLEDLGKVRLRKLFYLFGGLGLFGIGIALLVVFMFKRDWKAALLGAVAFTWGALLMNQSMRERAIENGIRESMSETDPPFPGEERTEGIPPAPEGEGQDEVEAQPHRAGSGTGERGEQGEP